MYAGGAPEKATGATRGEDKACGENSKAPRVPEPCGPDCELRWSEWSAARFDASHPIATELGISAQSTELLPSEGACERGEEKAFRATCASTIAWMRRHNNETRGRRALFFEYRGDRNALGWGHALTAAYGLHGICRLLRRYCYVSLYDIDLGEFYGYADGSSWARPGPAELAQYHSISTIKATSSATFSREGLAGLLSELRHRKRAQASLIHVLQEPPLYLGVGGDSWFPRLMPLRRAQPALSSHASPQFDRCFCRYVTEPRFSQEVSARFDVAYHLRTGFADTKATALRAAYQVTESQRRSEATRWLNAACGAAGITTLSSQRAVVLSDSPGLMRLLHSRYNATVGAAREVLGSTRSFTGAAQSAKLATARDVWLAGLASEVQELWTSSFTRPVVARSMCIRRRHLLTGPHGACSDFSRVYIRDLPRYLPGGKNPIFYSCLHWPQQHPCSKGTAQRCVASFVSANS